MKGTASRPKPAKVSRPRIAGTILREHLYEKLDRAAAPLLWISGPAGTGKTTLVSGYAEARRLPCVWYQVDSGDSDLATFFHFLGLASKRRRPPKRAFPHLTHDYLLGVDQFSRSFFEHLFEELSPPGLLVLDDLHLVADDAALHSALVQGISRLPEGVRAVAISRGLPPPPYARFLANRELETFHWEDLRLSFEEFRAIAVARGMGTYADEVFETLYRRMDGWAAGLQLSLQAVKTGQIDVESVGESTPFEVFDYFKVEVFERFDAETQEFLLKTALLPTVTSQLAEELTGVRRSDSLLQNLYRRNCFLQRRCQPEPTYDYHPLFREFLLQRAGDSLGARLTEAKRRAASALEEAGQSEAAASLRAAAGDWRGLTKLILREARSLLEQGRGRVLAQWLGYLPSALVPEDPWLLFWRGASRPAPEASEAKGDLVEAFRRFRADAADREGLFLSWSRIVESVLSGAGDFAELETWIEVLTELLQESEPPEGEAAHRVAASAYAALLLRKPLHPDLPKWERKARETIEGDRDVDRAVQILVHSVLGKCYLADGPGAEDLLQEIGRLCRLPAASPLSRIRGLFSQALHQNTFGFFERAGKLTEEALFLGERTGVHVMDLMLLSLGARSALDRDDLAAARRLLDRMGTDPLGGLPWSRSFFLYLSAGLSLREEDTPRAQRLSEAALGAAETAGVSYLQAAGRLLRAEVAAEAGDLAGGRAHLSEAERLSEEKGYAQLQVSCLLARAKIAFDEGASPEALRCLEQATALSRAKAGIVPYLFRPPVLAETCARALQAGGDREVLQDLIARCGVAPSPKATAWEDWPWLFRIYTLGRFELVREGSPLRPSRKTQQRPLALIRALIAFGGRGVAETRITEALWPDAEGDLAHRSLAITLHRLRKLLGTHEAVTLRDGKLSLDADHCWVDAWAFERLLNRAEEHWKAGTAADGQAAESLSRQALALYKGPFLAQEVAEHWSLALRERLRRRYVKGIESLGRYLERQDRWEQAAEAYRGALDQEPLEEEFYRLLMQCLTRMDRAAEAAAVYQRCRRVLARSLGSEPSGETSRLHAALRPS
jgi:LuxR family transcriptional regulator, maltose regulon positive regulatory protein